jgi:hypothetical protein
MLLDRLLAAAQGRVLCLFWRATRPQPLAHRHHDAYRPVSPLFCCCPVRCAGWPAALAQPAAHEEVAAPAARRASRRGAAQGRGYLLATRPNDAQLRFLKGVAQSQSGATATGRAGHLHRLTQDYPELPEPYNNLAVLHAGAGQLEPARAATSCSSSTPRRRPRRSPTSSSTSRTALRRHGLPPRHRRLHDPGRRLHADMQQKAHPRADPERGRQRPEERPRHHRHGAHQRPDSATAQFFINVPTTPSSTTPHRPAASATPCSARSSPAWTWSTRSAPCPPATAACIRTCRTHPVLIHPQSHLEN